jgi:hydroxymethylpyrimidine/phosphomethylpyrimidine kinase
MGDRGSPVRPRALTIAGSDSGGGAGIQADLKTFSALGVYGMSAITAVTVQNTKGVASFHEIPPRTVADQIEAVASDIGVDAAKTGMLASAPIIEAVANQVRASSITNLVIDPVFVSKHGHRLLAEDAIGALTGTLIQLAVLVTPNLHEAEGLTGLSVSSRDEMRKAAEAILELGPRAVLVKGGHLGEGATASDLYLDDEREEWVEAERIDTTDTHGTGCTLSAAATARLAAGDDLFEAVVAAKAFVTESIRGSLRLGAGIGPVDQLWPVSPPDLGIR